LVASPLTDVPPEYWDLVMAVNVKGPLLCARAVVPGMRNQEWGRIINISSIGAYMAGGVYSVSKLAVNQLTWGLATQLGASGITVNGIAPGVIDNEATQRQVQRGAIDSLINSNIIKRSGRAEDMYGMIRYLSSDEAGWITGQTFLVNGGFSTRF
jgi:NAD(P)-dependent dehydrogenase (short-subunit alcohol dehydrogenase family)